VSARFSTQLSRIRAAYRWDRYPTLSGIVMSVPGDAHLVPSKLMSPAAMGHFGHETNRTCNRQAWIVAVSSRSNRTSSAAT